MRKNITLTIVALFLTGSFFFILAQNADHLHYFPHGKVVEGLSMQSNLGERDIDYAVYLPPDYDHSDRHYPVVYLLHGYSDNETAWIQFGEVNATADRAIANREIPPMIIVMPDAGVSWYINNFDQSDPFEDIMINEFIPFIDKTFRTRKERAYRAVSGLSMGGYGSLILALKHPDLFSSCAAFSAAVFTDDEVLTMADERYNRFFKNIYGADADGNRLTDYWHQHSVINLVKTLPGEDIKRIRFYIDNGDDDFLFEGNAMLHIAMRKQNIPHQFRVRDGAHNWSYWRTHVIEGLKFIGEGFNR